MVENYTLSFMVSAFFVVFIALFAIWASWGLIAALGSGWMADRALAHAQGNGK